MMASGPVNGATPISGCAASVWLNSRNLSVPNDELLGHEQRADRDGHRRLAARVAAQIQDDRPNAVRRETRHRAFDLLQDRLNQEQVEGDHADAVDLVRPHLGNDAATGGRGGPWRSSAVPAPEPLFPGGRFSSRYSIETRVPGAPSSRRCAARRIANRSSTGRSGRPELLGAPSGRPAICVTTKPGKRPALSADEPARTRVMVGRPSIARTVMPGSRDRFHAGGRCRGGGRRLTRRGHLLDVVFVVGARARRSSCGTARARRSSG